MDFQGLKDFLLSKMKLSHIYQPLLIRTLVDAGGSATVRQLAGAFLLHDESQLLYYEKRLKEMPIRVLKNHGVIRKEGDLVSLNVGKLSLQQQAQLRQICEEKLQGYIASRGLAIWNYLLDENPVPDTLRNRVLAEAKGRCALCGATRDETPLDVDHIIPRSKGGKTEYANLQALCAKCNRSKGNKSSADHRNIIEQEVDENCPFCDYFKNGDKPVENDHAFGKPDEYPVTEGHTLIIPIRHVAGFFDLTKKEHEAVQELLTMRKKQLTEEDQTIEGFNIGVNAGAAAGQTIFHCHVHLIPRRKGDVHDPRGGIRAVIEAKMKYPFDHRRS
jgi:ATP adenylyltransferase